MKNFYLWLIYAYFRASWEVLHANTEACIQLFMLFFGVCVCVCVVRKDKTKRK